MITVNAMGDSCPIPVIKTKKAMQALTGRRQSKYWWTMRLRCRMLQRWLLPAVERLHLKSLGKKEYKVTIAMGGAAVTADDAEETACIPDARDNMVVVVSSDRMGSGNDELGKVLIKGFIYAVTQLDKLPKTMLFYNGGATLTCEGSDSLEDLKSLEGQGVNSDMLELAWIIWN